MKVQGGSIGCRGVDARIFHHCRPLPRISLTCSPGETTTTGTILLPGTRTDNLDSRLGRPGVSDRGIRITEMQFPECTRHFVYSSVIFDTAVCDDEADDED